MDTDRNYPFRLGRALGSMKRAESDIAAAVSEIERQFGPGCWQRPSMRPILRTLDNARNEIGVALAQERAADQRLSTATAAAFVPSSRPAQGGAR